MLLGDGLLFHGLVDSNQLVPLLHLVKLITYSTCMCEVSQGVPHISHVTSQVRGVGKEVQKVLLPAVRMLVWALEILTVNQLVLIAMEVYNTSSNGIVHDLRRRRRRWKRKWTAGALTQPLFETTWV